MGAVRSTRQGGEAGPRKARPPRRRVLLLEQIVDAAGIVFAERGVAAATLQDVADVLGISRAAVYYHVRSRDELLRLVVEGYIALHREWLRALRERADLTPEQRLREAIHILTRGFETHPHLSRIFLRGETELPADLRAEQRRSRRVIQKEMVLILRDGIASGHFGDLDPELTAFGIFGMINWMHVWFAPDGRVSAQEVADLFADLILGGIRAGEARRRPGTALESIEEIQQIAASLAAQLAAAGSPAGAAAGGSGARGAR